MMSKIINNSVVKSKVEDKYVREPKCFSNKRGIQYPGEYLYKKLETKINTNLSRLRHNKDKPLLLLDEVSRFNSKINKNSSQPAILRSLQPGQEKSIVFDNILNEKPFSESNDAFKMSNNFKKYFVEGNHSRNMSYLFQDTNKNQTKFILNNDERSVSFIYKTQERCGKVHDNLVYNSNIFTFNESQPEQTEVNPLKITVDTKNPFLQKLVTTVCLDYNGENYDGMFKNKLNKASKNESFLPRSTINNIVKKECNRARTTESEFKSNYLNNNLRCQYGSSFSKGTRGAGNQLQIMTKKQSLTSNMHTKGIYDNDIKPNSRKVDFKSFVIPIQSINRRNESEDFNIEEKLKSVFSSIDTSSKSKLEEIELDSVRLKHKLEEKFHHNKELQLSYDNNRFKHDLAYSLNHRPK